MIHGHYPAMTAAYLVALAGFVFVWRFLPGLWAAGSADDGFSVPWKELGFALLGAIGIVAMGQLWSRGIRLPERGPLGPILAAVNQLLIFAPILLVPALRRQSWTTAWLPRPRIPQRVLVGLVLSSLAVVAYSVLREGADKPWQLLSRIWRYERIDEATQVLLEDVAIAILFVRLAAAIGKGRATLVVASLFAAGHIPAMVSAGATSSEFAGLVRDAGLGALAILALRRSRDVLWFWPVHFCLDMTQFAHVSGVG